VTAAHVLIWAGFILCTLAAVAQTVKPLRDGHPKLRQSRARRDARAHSTDVLAQLTAIRLELESWLGQHSPCAPAGGNGDHPREHAG
jgi:hypothetical protein